MAASLAPMGTCSAVRLVSRFIFPALESGLRWYRSDGVGRDCRGLVPARSDVQHAGRRNIVPRALHGFPAGTQVVGTGLHRAGLEPRGAERRAHLRLAAGRVAVRIFVWSRLDGDI